MRTVEECYEYVLKRCDELAAQRRRKREIALKAAAPVCGIAVIAGTAAVLRNGRMGTNGPISAVNSAFSEPKAPNSAAESTPKYEDKLNIGEVEISKEGVGYLYGTVDKPHIKNQINESKRIIGRFITVKRQ